MIDISLLHLLANIYKIYLQQNLNQGFMDMVLARM